MGLHHKDVLREILGLSGKKTAPKVSGAGRGEPAQRRFGGSSQSKSLNPKTAKRRLLRDPEGEPKYGRPVHQRQEAWVASGALGHAGVELGENGSILPRYHPNYLHATLQRISPRWSRRLDFLAQMNLARSSNGPMDSGLCIRPYPVSH